MKNILRSLPSALLVLLFVYAAVSKLADIDTFRGQLYNQAFSHKLADWLLFALPAAELITVILLLVSNRYGLWSSLLLMFVFTGYIALVKLGFWSRVPCSCGGILSHMGWTAHLIFNIFFLLLSVMGLLYREE